MLQAGKKKKEEHSFETIRLIQGRETDPKENAYQ